MSFLLRVAVPDRLGSVASAVGAAGGDIVGTDVVEHRGDGYVVDDFLVELPAGRLPDALVSACRSVPDVAVEFVGRYSQGASLHRDLEAVEAMTDDPSRAEEILVDLVPGIFRSGWALLLTPAGSTVKVQRASGGAPEADGYQAPWLPLSGPARITLHDSWAPESWHDVEAVAVPVADTGQAVVFGRDGGPHILDSELARLVHLVALAQVIRGTASAGRGQRERQHLSGTAEAQLTTGNRERPPGVGDVVDEQDDRLRAERRQ